MGSTQIFTDAPFSELSELPKDIINFGFYTCFCFQWTIFENFVKKSIMDLVHHRLLPLEVGRKLKTLERRTWDFFKYIDEKHVFGCTPFTTVLPVAGWIPKFENCDFKDLDCILRQRNRFIHAVENPLILPSKKEVEKEQSYERSMWILRQFAGNLDQDVQNIRMHSSRPTGST